MRPRPRLVALVVALLACAWAGSANAAIFRVNSTADKDDARAGDGICSTTRVSRLGPPVKTTCTLRAAIDEANALGGNNTILVPSGNYVLGRGLIISGALTIKGAGADATALDGNHAVPVAVILDHHANVSIADLTIRNGKGGGHNEAGGIETAGTLTLDSVDVVGNEGPIAGGVYSDPQGSPLTIRNSTFSQNSGYTIYAQGEASLDHVDVTGNSGRAIYFDKSATIDDSTIENNIGGAAIETNAPLTVTGTTIAGNSGGGILQDETVPSSPATLTNSTIVANGYALESRGDSATFLNDTISGNTFGIGGQAGSGIPAATFFLTSTILDGNGSGNCGPLGTTKITSGGHNIDSGTSCGLKGPHDRSGVDPKLGPLADNGGPTKTEALLPGSPAIDAADSATCPTTDQRGVKRPAGLGCDIGAFEFDVVADLALTLKAAPAAPSVGQTLTYVATVKNKGSNPATSVALQDPLPSGVALVSATPSQGSCSGTVNCRLGTIAVGGSAQVTIVVRAMSAGDVRDTATVKADQIDPDLTNNTARVVTTVLAPTTGRGTPPTTGGGGKSPATVLQAKLLRVQARRVHGRVRVVVRLSLNEPAIARLRLFRGSRLVGARGASARAGTAVLTLVSGKRSPPGRYVLKIALRDSVGHTGAFTVRVFLR